ncbi:hypothetical protein AAIM60_13370 [Pseudomonas lijiangensis]|jgi:hypothetical protein|uniref:hypothetical protein n=1 Tax=Pseudomonas lijiangensis TaxID=2995658 RepID=UPI0031BB9FC1
METQSANEEDVLEGAKAIQILASTRYPIVSAYEFEFLKEEAVIQERMNSCTLYLILQRPLTYMNNVRPEPDGIYFDIVDDHQPPLHCYLPLVENRITSLGEVPEFHIQFLKKDPDTEPPCNDVAGFKIWREDGTFAVWYSPHKFLYEVLAGSLKAIIDGDPHRFLDFKVHYIGQAFSQRVWKRLTSHDKLRKVLTIEGPVSEKKGNRVAWEVSLAMLSIDGFDEVNMLPVSEWMDLGPGKPVIHNIKTDEEFQRFLSPAISSDAPQLTNEAEAMLIARFKPDYNKVRFDKYPDITNGTRSVGYTTSELQIDKLPVTLYTDTFRMEAIT